VLEDYRMHAVQTGHGPRDQDQPVPKVLCSRARLIPGVLLPIGPRECAKASGPMLVMLR
jgi:hypothetical protein